MKKFLRQVVHFALYPIGYCLVVFCFNFFIFKTQDYAELQCENLVIGDSHPQRAIDPRFLKDCKNVSQLTEPYILTYWKLKAILPDVKPRRVMIGFSPHNFSQFNDLKFSEETWAAEIFRRIVFIQEFSTLEDVPVDRIQFLKTSWKQVGLIPKLNQKPFIGYYENSKKSNVTNASKVLDRHYKHNDSPLGVSRTAINYLDSIISICNAHNAQPILVATPLHPSYLDGVPESISSAYGRLSDSLTAADVYVFRFEEDVADSLFMNTDHLNQFGAEVFTKALSAELEIKP